MSILIPVFYLIFAILSLKRIDWALMFILAGLPLYLVRFNILSIPSTLLEGMILIAFFVWILKNYKELFENLKLKINHCLKIENCKLKIINRYPFDIEIALLLIISFIAVGISGFNNSALGIWKAYFFEPIMVYILIFNVFFSQAKKPAESPPGDSATTANIESLQITNLKLQISKIIFPLAVSAFFVSLIAIAQKFGWLDSPANFWPRITGPYEYPNALGLFLGPIILLLAGSFMFQIFNFQFSIFKQFSISQFLKIIVSAIGILASLFAVFFARSEGALVGIAVAVLLCAYLIFLSKKFIPSLARKIGLGLLPVIFLAVLFYPLIVFKIFPEHSYPDFGNPTYNYLYDKATLKDFSGEVRKQQWRETWEMMTASPSRFVFGTGLSGYQKAVEPFHQEGIYFNKDRDPDFRRKIVLFDEKYKAEHWRPVEIYMYPHNLLLNFWTELGIAGALLILWTLFRVLKIGIYKLFENWKLEIENYRLESRKYILLGVIGAIFVIMAHGIVDVPYFKNDLAVLFWVLIALVGVMDLLAKRKENDL